jgi:diaminopimelate epimerase
MDFVKTQALGNDFILVERDATTGRSNAQLSGLAQAICNRHFGVGADGLILWKRRDDLFDLQIINCDGSEAECSGNGLRCVAAWLMESKIWKQTEVRLRTVSGIYVLRRVGHEYEADMGTPAFRPEEIPFIPGPEGRTLDKVIQYPLRIGDEIHRVTLCSTGNPHCSLFVAEIHDESVRSIGPALEHHPAFPNRTNVEFIRVLNRGEIEVAFWERGVGATFASGTGSCGATVASILNGKTERTVTVHTKGGKLTVSWPENGRLTLTSTAGVVAEGRYLES